MLFILTAYALTAYAQTNTAAQQPSWMDMLLPFFLIFVIFYFLIIRPQSKRHKTQQQFLTNLKRGDLVLTTSGILGTIEGITEKYVTLEIASEVRIKILKSHVSGSAQTSAIEGSKK